MSMIAIGRPSAAGHSPSGAAFGLRRRAADYRSREDLREMLDALGQSFERRAFKHRKSSPALAKAFKGARLFDHGRDSFNTGGLNYTGDTIKAMLLDLSAAGTFNKIVTGVTNVAPAVYTSAAHGFANDDVIVTLGIGGSLGANQTGIAASVAANTFQMTTFRGLAVNNPGAFASNGFAVNLTQAVFVAGILGNRVSVDQTLAGKTSSRGTANATSPIAWPVIAAGNAVQCMILYDAAGGSDATNRLIAFQDGQVSVIVDKAVLANDLAITVEPLVAQLWDGATGPAPVLNWSDGHASTLNAAANQGDRALTITAQAAGGVAIGSTADMKAFGGGFPFTPAGFAVNFTIGQILAPFIGGVFPTGLYEL